MRASLPIAAAFLAACSPPGRPPEPADASLGAMSVDPASTRAAGHVLGQQAYIKASNTDMIDYFGKAVALSGDGSTLAVGAYWEDSRARGIDGDQSDNSASDAGAVYVFVRTGREWRQESYVKASNTGSGDTFGRSLALSEDGSTLAVSAMGEDSRATGIDGDQLDNSASSSGAVYVFTRTGKTWSQQAYLKASNTSANDRFGFALALSEDGSTLAVSADGEDSAAPGIGGNEADNSASSSGAVYVFARSGAVWSQQAYVKASNPGAGDTFGWSVALSADGSTLAVGADGEDSAATGIGGDQLDNSVSNAGAVYVFIRDGATWRQEAYVKASDPHAQSDLFGTTVALSGDGSTVAVGESRGRVFVLKRHPAWSQQAWLRGAYTDSWDYFGESIALSSDGSILAAGARNESSAATGVDGNQADDSLSFSGAAYLFTFGTVWSQRAYLKASNTGADHRFGTSVALSADGSTVAVGAPGEPSKSSGINSVPNEWVTDAGAVYVFH